MGFDDEKIIEEMIYMHRIEALQETVEPLANSTEVRDSVAGSKRLPIHLKEKNVSSFGL